MKFRFLKSLIILFVSSHFFINAEILGDLKVCALMVEFQVDSTESTTGDGTFLQSIEGIDCDLYHIDPPPHNNSYFHSQLKAANNYFRSSSYGKFGLDMVSSNVMPLNNSTYILPNKMSYYYPYNQDSLAEVRLVELYEQSLRVAYAIDGIDFSDYDLVLVFHAGIGQDFSLPFLDPTPEDIPSTFIDSEMIELATGTSGIAVGNTVLNKGVILPESQNHLNFDISSSMFAGEPDPCDYQFGLNGTLSLMIGFAIGLPPLWDIENGKSRIGVFGLMDQGSNNGRGLIPSPPDPWSRVYAGWDTPNTISSNSQVFLPKRSENNLIKVDINEFEYFMIENRNNHFKPGISIDSIRYKIYQDTNDYPSFIKSLVDSVEVEKDENGVLIKLPNYDLGLPASGLLIWHIDERLINNGINSYEINKDLSQLGVDLEESDGAQDIGFDSFFMFDDPSAGYFGDMWFAENQEYYRANSQNEGILPVFNSQTYPNTNSNDGSNSYLSFENIGSAEDTISFNIYNYLKPYGFRDTSCFYRLGIRPEGFENNIIVGGSDSLWFTSNFGATSKKYFHKINSNELTIGFSKVNDNFFLEIFEYNENSTSKINYKFSDSFEKLEFFSSLNIDSLTYPIYSDDFSSISYLNENQWNSHKSNVFGETTSYKLDRDSGYLVSYRADNIENLSIDNISTASLIGIDISLNDKLNALVIEDEGSITAYDNSLHVMSGFPLNKKTSGKVLAKDIVGNDYPEIIVKSLDSSKIFIFDHKGVLVQSISSSKNDNIMFFHTINQKNHLFTRYSVLVFDEETNDSGNSWTNVNGDIRNSRKLELNYSSVSNSDDLILRAYCYPNPIKYVSTSKIRVETYDAKSIALKVYDSNGISVDEFSNYIQFEGTQISEWDFDITNLESGIYFGYLEVKPLDFSGKKESETLIKIAVIK